MYLSILVKIIVVSGKSGIVDVDEDVDGLSNLKAFIGLWLFSSFVTQLYLLQSTMVNQIG